MWQQRWMVGGATSCSGLGLAAAVVAALAAAGSGCDRGKGLCGSYCCWRSLSAAFGWRRPAADTAAADSWCGQVCCSCSCRSRSRAEPRLRLRVDPTAGDRCGCGVLLRLTASAARITIPADAADAGGSCCGWVTAPDATSWLSVNLW